MVEKLFLNLDEIKMDNKIDIVLPCNFGVIIIKVTARIEYFLSKFVILGLAFVFFF